METVTAYTILIAVVLQNKGIIKINRLRLIEGRIAPYYFISDPKLPFCCKLVICLKHFGDVI